MTTEEIKKKLNQMGESYCSCSVNDKEELKRELNKITAKLDSREKQIIYDKFIHRLTLKEIADKHCYTYKYLKVKLNRMYKKMITI